MKKIWKMALVMLMVLGLAACGSKGDEGDKKGSDDVDMSKYPAALEEWSGQNFIDYFVEVGAFIEGEGYETWLQDHANYWFDTPINECAGWWNEEGTDMVMICTMSADNADTSEEQLTEWKNSAKEKHTFPGDYATLPVDHMVGNTTFTFENTILDEDVYESFKAAYEELLTKTNATAEF